jgi:hypothetical protein
MFAWTMSLPRVLFAVFSGLPLVGLGSFAVQRSIDLKNVPVALCTNGPDGDVYGTSFSSDDVSSDTTTGSDNGGGTSSMTSTQADQIIKLLQELLAELQSGQGGNSSVSGYLFDQQS